MKSTLDLDDQIPVAPLYEAVTESIRITVLPKFIPENSNVETSNYYYAYTITMTNEGRATVQLMKRHWEIKNGFGDFETVDGEGVVGEKPILAPGESYSYTSACPLDTPTGSMKGYYTFKNPSGKSLKIKIPEFQLRDKSLLN